MVFYGCGVKFYENETPEEPNNLVVVSKTKRMFTDKATKEVTQLSDMSKVYHHFNYNCLSHHNKFFNVAFIKVQNDPLPSLSPIHKQALNGDGVKV